MGPHDGTGSPRSQDETCTAADLLHMDEQRTWFPETECAPVEDAVTTGEMATGLRI